MQKLLAVGGTALLALASLLPEVASAQAPSPTVWYRVVNRGNNKCVDVRGGATANGTVIQQLTCNNTTAQQFQFQPTSGGFTLPVLGSVY